MKKHSLAALFLFSGAVSLPVTSLAQAPTFNCKKANAEVEKRICADASLATLDRKLDGVYTAASAKAKGKLANQLLVEQRGWIKGRNDCWKANGNQTWITATWTVDTINACIEAQYRLRTSELQAVWQLLPPSKTNFYACQNNPANEVVAHFFATDPATIRLERGDRTVTMWLVGSANDGNYEGQNVSLKLKESEIHVSWLDTRSGKTDELQCKVK